MKGNKIVLDLEFTPLRDPDLQAVAGNEIIEIGAVKLDEENRKVKVTISMFGRDTLVELDVNQLTEA